MDRAIQETYESDEYMMFGKDMGETVVSETIGFDPPPIKTYRFGDNPGKICMWFGDYEGKLFGQLDMGYRLQCILDRREHDCEDLRKFEALHYAYNDWRDERECPLTEKVWLVDDYTGQEFRVIWRQKAQWDDRLERYSIADRMGMLGIKERYLRWRELHPPKVGRARTSGLIVNRKGELLGPQDDSPSPDEADHEEADFVVNDDNNEPNPDESYKPSTQDDCESSSPNSSAESTNHMTAISISSSAENVAKQTKPTRKIAQLKQRELSFAPHVLVERDTNILSSRPSQKKSAKTYSKGQRSKSTQSNTLKTKFNATSSSQECTKQDVKRLKMVDCQDPASNDTCSVQPSESESSQEVVPIDTPWRARRLTQRR